MEKYKCCKCGATDIKPLSNGDGKDYCEDCAVKIYKSKFPYGMPVFKKTHLIINTNTA